MLQHLPTRAFGCVKRTAASRYLQPILFHHHQRKMSATALPQLAVYVKGTDEGPQTLEKLKTDLEGHANVTDGSNSDISTVDADGCWNQGRGFNGQLFMRHLNSRSLGRMLLATPLISSTQDFLRTHQSKFPSGTVLTAERQSSGRGRGGNQWTSPAGCLMFTASKAIAIQGQQAPFINYVVCLGVLRGISEAVKKMVPDAPALPIRIKWPNDIYYVPPGHPSLINHNNNTTSTAPSSQSLATQLTNLSINTGNATTDDNASPLSSATPLKIGGALMHTTWSGGGFNLLMGVGLNLYNKDPTTCIQAILQEAVQRQRESLQGPVSSSSSTDDVLKIAPEVLLACVISQLDACFSTFESHGFAPLEQEYLDSWMHTNQAVMFERYAEQSVNAIPGQSQTLATPGGTTGAVQEAEASHVAVLDGGSKDLVALRIKGVSSSGFLLAVEEGTGREYELTPDGNSLDMMAGLIRKKVT